MALQGGHRFAVSMDEVFPHGLYAMSVDQAQDFDEKTRARTPSKDKQTGSLVWSVTCIDRDPEARVKEVKVKLLAPYMPELPPEIVPGSGLRPIAFSGMTITPYIDEGRGRARLAYSMRATGLAAAQLAQPGVPGGPGQEGAGRAPAGSATSAPRGPGQGRSGGQASAA
ncbi:plasmid replication, integration and excision activator [Spongisporangium articulatum]|uniref:Plasmid replication, integration and excision activator n=1 Tax=Spongisporangium articulatum TaxID=3362603 RepID=A0ABW8AKR9_9ACTN